MTHDPHTWAATTAVPPHTATDLTGAAVPELPGSATEPDGSVVIRVLSYNVRSLRDDPGALAAVVRACAPDVLCVQEAPRFFRWRKAAARLARDCGLVYTTGGATAAGPMLLTSLRARVEHTEDVLLPRAAGQHRRGLATAVLRFGNVRVGVVSCHLSLLAAERRSQADLVRKRLAEWDVPHAVLAGDINERPTGEAFDRLSSVLTDAYRATPWGGEHTMPADDPRQRIDAVFTTEGVEVLGCGVPVALPGVQQPVLRADLAAATDHLPVLAALRLPAATVR